MKSRILFVLTALCVVAVALTFASVDPATPYARYHQHLEQPSAEKIGLCVQCSGEADLCTHLPLICIETGGQKIPGAAILNDEHNATIGYETGDHGETEIIADISIIDTANVMHHADDTPSVVSQTLLRYRGNSSRAFDKHSYSISLIQNSDPLQNNNLPLLGMSADNSWTLHGPFLDKTLLRNYMWMNISAEVMGYAPNVRFCELLVDGEYQGVYVLMENISRGEGRVNLTKYEEGDLITSYILRIGSNVNPLKRIDAFTLYTLRLEEKRELEILYPTKQYQTPEVQNYIYSDFSEIERLLFSAEMYDGTERWDKYLDIDSFVDYYILQEFLAVNDMFSNSTYFYRDIRGKIHIGPVWDYNNVLDNFFTATAMDELHLSQRGWYSQLMTNKNFVERIITRYRELREGILSAEYLNQYLDETIAWLGDAVERNYSVWGYSFNPLLLDSYERRNPPVLSQQEADLLLQQNLPNRIRTLWNNTKELYELNPTTYEEALEQMRSAMNRRGAWLDRNIETLRQYCAESKYATHILN